MSLVVDNSITMAWCFQDEATPFTEAILDQTRAAGAVAPAIWPFEVANVLLLAERRRRLTSVDIRDFIDFLEVLPIAVEPVGLVRVFGNVLIMGQEQGLTSYDAAYLELAMRQGLPLATLDGRLREAATRAGVPLMQ